MLMPYDIAGKEFIVLQETGNLINIDEDMLAENIRYIVLTNNGLVNRVFNVSALCRDYLKNIDCSQINIDNMTPSIQFAVYLQDIEFIDLQSIDAEVIVLIDESKSITGIIDDLSKIKQLIESFLDYNQDIKETLLEYEKIFENLDEEIFVSDQNGYIIRLNPAAERICGLKNSEAVGRHVTELEREGYYSSSITMPVLHQKKKVNMIQQMKSGKKVIGTAVPVFNAEGEIVRVISTSKDLEELTKLQLKLEERDNEIMRKTSEINALREEILSSVNFIYKSKEMHYIKETIAKVAGLDLTVLIQGESGVGKEVITKAIHALSARRKHPFIKINCGLIPENLIESELFGYESGAFTGATKGGKLGKIELANNGTLFLDEIGEFPLMIQVKLLEFLQDREICKVGGTKKIKINTRVIAATNRSLPEMVEEGTFRKDLYYRLNVIPLIIPPLRERREDIPVLVDFFLKKFNQKYGMNKMIEPGLIDIFYSYNWPGNVRELEHVMERAIVISESDIVKINTVENFLEIKATSKKVICTDLIPLKQAKRELEEQLVKTAYEIYKSTYKAAKVLEVDQSTIVKLLKKYK